MSTPMDRLELRKKVIGMPGVSVSRGGALIAANMTPWERSMRSKKAAATRWAGHVASDRAMKRKARELAVSMVDNAIKVEPQITRAVKQVIRENDGRMEGLQYRLKGADSLRRKIYTKAKEKGLSISESADRISDSIRYTAVIGEPPPGHYAQTVKNIMKTMEKNGLEVLNVETHWRRGDAYNGIHVIARHPSGAKVEMQFHTEESLAAKKKTHKLYEIARADDTPPAERARLVREMVKIADAAPIPKGALNVGTRVFRPPTVED